MYSCSAEVPPSEVLQTQLNVKTQQKTDRWVVLVLSIV
jgi:hypothetical protein